MIPLGYYQVRWFVGFITVVIAVLLRLLPLESGGLVGFILLLLASAASTVYPPGIYAWLVRATCPECGRKAEWFIESDVQSPYQEVMGVRCRECDFEKIEFEYRPDYGLVQPKHDSEHC